MHTQTRGYIFFNYLVKIESIYESLPRSQLIKKNCQSQIKPLIRCPLFISSIACSNGVLAVYSKHDTIP